MRVLKFGGKSLLNVERFDFIAKKLATQNMTDSIIVVSAMGDTTSELFKMTSALNALDSSKREHDMLLTSGERISAALMSMALQKYGVNAQSFTGSQAGILTSGPHTNADIKEVKPFRIKESLEKGIVPVVAGFQGVDPDLKDITTLGRGGSDLTAVALAHHFNGHVEFYKSIGGVFTCDPNLNENAKPIKNISHNFLKNMSGWGGKVIHEKAAILAQKNNTTLKFLDDVNFELITQTVSDCDNYAISCLDSIITILIKNKEITHALDILNMNFKESDNQNNYKVIASAFDSGDSRFMIKTEPEVKENFISLIKSFKEHEILQTDLIGVSCIFSNQPSNEEVIGLYKAVEEVPIKRLLETSNRYTFFIKNEDKKRFLNSSHGYLSSLGEL